MFYSIILCTIDQTHAYNFPETFLKLGREREQFGDPFPYPINDEQSEWNCNQTTFPLTNALFPAGASDRRIYLKSTPSWTEKGLPPGMQVFFVKKIKNRVIPQWKIHLYEARNQLASIPPTAGTLETLFYRMNLDVGNAMVPKAAWPVLKARKLFATYLFEPVISSVECGILQENGTYLQLEHPLNLSTYGSKPYPYIGYDYPILPEEVRYLKQSIEKSK